MGNKKKLINDLLNRIDGGVEVAASYLGLSISAFNDRVMKIRVHVFLVVMN